MIQLKSNLVKGKISHIIPEIDTPVTTKTVSSKPSRVDFDIVIDKPSKQESHRSSKINSYPVIEVKQTVKSSDEQVNTRKEIQTAQIENTNKADNNNVQQNNEEWRKGTTLIWGTQQYLDLSRKRCPEIGKSKSDISQEQKLKTCTTMQFLC